MCKYCCIISILSRAEDNEAEGFLQSLQLIQKGCILMRSYFSLMAHY